ncbi:MAG: electron transfer flavoprotein subunit alpha/FixB family protein [Chloroflexi bacterium]|nr:electron transfer flavoprotein subunit alpha/FixB family protein [Chloroflexota bacterium]
MITPVARHAKTGEGVWVFVEHLSARLSEDTLALVTEGRRLARCAGTTLRVVVTDTANTEEPQILLQHGVQQVYRVHGMALEQPAAEAYANTLVDLLVEHRAAILLLSSNPLYDDLAARVAARLQTGAMINCTSLNLGADGVLFATRLIYGGRFQATLTCSVCPQIVTLSTDTLPISEPDPARHGEIIQVAEYRHPTLTELVQRVRQRRRTADLEEAEIIVAGGRGMGGQEGFQLLQELADLLGGMVAATRAAVDAGWVPLSWQVGATGKTVHPKLYIAWGISGAYPHTVGMRDSETVIAINKDSNAPIFSLADLGIVGDVREVLPAIIRHLRQEKPSGGEYRLY